LIQEEILQQLFKTEYRKIISVLCKLFGMVHIEIAEDIAHDTFLKATETWEQNGVPENPTAWLYLVAKNKTKDYLKRNHTFTNNIISDFKNNPDQSDHIEIDLSSQNIKDSQLQMIFAICDPIIPAEAQIGLALRILCGFGIDELAEAFLTNKETINKRLYRAKEKLRLSTFKIESLHEFEINKRLETVLTTIYLLFNEGYHSTTNNTYLRKELCLEAMQLNYFLLENNSTNKPSVNALMSLMCFHASRFDSRLTKDGDPVLYDNQNKEFWDDELIQKGNYYLIESAKGNEISKYHLEASIAYWHSTKIENQNKWDHILDLYNQLLQIEYSPMAALNRTYALSKVFGKEKAIHEALKLNLVENQFYHSMLGHLYTNLDTPAAIKHFQMALRLAKTTNDKKIIENYLTQISQ
jgi:RNA polymerase sigma factor (sigma-70 family)